MPKPSVRFRIDFGRDVAVGPGKIALLEHIDRSGSLSQAARELKMSYRYAWMLLDSLNSAFRERVVVSSVGGQQGGGTLLTPFGLSLIRAYRDFDAAMQAQSKRHFAGFARLARRPPAGVRKAPVTPLSAR